MEDLITQFGSQLILLVVITLTSLSAAVAVRGRRPGPFGIAPVPACLAIGSALAVAAITLTPQTGARIPGQLQLQPFHTILLNLHDARYLTFYLGGNIVMFMPLGFFLYLALRRGVLLPGALTVLASITVELLQLPIWSRSTDVDDVILNSIGGLIGVLAAVGFRAAADRADRAGRRPRRARTPAAHIDTEFATLLPRD